MLIPVQKNVKNLIENTAREMTDVRDFTVLLFGETQKHVHQIKGLYCKRKRR